MIEPSDLEAMPSDEYELDAPPTGPTPPSAPAPIPRIWKSEDSDPEDGPESDRAGGSERPGSPRGQVPPAPSRRPESPSRDAKKPTPSSTSPDKSDDPDKKKVLVEETPEWDTYEARRRARLVLGLGMVSFILIVGWAGYRMFLYDPGDGDLGDESDVVQASTPSTAPNLDLEARAMLDRAKEHEKEGRRQESLALLEKVVKVYSKLPAAKSAAEAIERARQDQPLFPDPPPPSALVEGGIPQQGNPSPRPPDPSRGNVPSPPPANFDSTRPPDPTKGLAMRTPAPTKPAPSAVPKPAPPPATVEPPKSAADASPPKPKMNTLPRGFQARVEDGIDESGWPKIIRGDRDDSPMIFIGGATFIMGANGGPSAESPAHRVRLRAYYIDRHEVTIEQFNKFLDDTGHRRLLPRNWTPGDGKARRESKSNPVTMVNFKDADAYAEWCKKQLPTEAQWEMAARSPRSDIYPWGSDPITWKAPREHYQIDPVMSFPQDVSAAGAFDMAGNVAEWTRDWFDLRYFQLFADSPAVDPTGPSRGSRTSQRVIKGGSKTWHASHREGMSQDRRLGSVGFRCVLNIISDPAASPARESAPPDRPNLTPVVPF